MARRMAARPALNRKNFTPASRETNTSVKMMPTPRCERKRNRTVERDIRSLYPAGRIEQALRPPGPPGQTALLGREALVHFRPVHHVPPRGDVVGPAVLVFQVVGVLPDVDAEHRLLAFHERAILVRRALDHELAAVIDHPRPSAAEPADRGFRDLFLHGVEAAE